MKMAVGCTYTNIAGRKQQNVGACLLTLAIREGLSNKLGKWNFDTKGFDYWVVSILGCQSSGKSTCRFCAMLCVDSGSLIIHLRPQAPCSISCLAPSSKSWIHSADVPRPQKVFGWAVRPT